VTIAPAGRRRSDRDTQLRVLTTAVTCGLFAG
jgi:hypothetical protein